MQAAANAAKLSATMANLLTEGAIARGLSIEAVTAIAPGMAKLAEHAATFSLDQEAVAKLADRLLTETMGKGDEAPEAMANVLVMAELASRDGQSPVTRVATVGASWDHGHGLAAKMGDAIATRLGQRMGLKMEPTMGAEMANLSLSDMAMHSARAAGLRPGTAAEAIRMASGTHSGSDFPFAIQNGLSAVLAKGFEVAKPAIALAARQVEAVDYRQRNAVRLSASGMPGLVNEGGEVNYTTVNEKGELAARPDDYANIFSVSRQALQNDSTALGLLADMGTKMVQGSVGRFRQVLLAPLLANSGLGQAMTDTLTLFHATHGNVAGTATALSVTSLSTARTAMRRQIGLKGEILALEPSALLVPPELETTAQQLVAQLLATKTSDVNPFANGLQIIVEPGLTSAIARYLLADPTRYDGLTFAYLEGQSAPSVETRDGWNTLGMEYRLVWAVGAAFIETASWYRNAGV